ncbi:unnamed protein product [Sphagnum jensenii]|uniref:RNA polymerase sigma-70 domain-containing protein n=1 Tax=Sphagnum jensenii TaxID=128206 RepID=A0ABP0VZ18_9BRYO
MQHAAGTMGLQSLKHLGQLLPFDAQDGASCFRHICLPPISAITVSIGDAAAVKKKVALQANKGLRPLEPTALKDHRTTRGALTLMHENISVGPHGNSAQLEEDFADSSMVVEMFPDHDARSLLERAILEVQWALSLEEILLSNETISQLKQRRKPKLKVKKAIEEEEESSPGSEASLSVKEPAVVSSGWPSARSRRLEARKQRLATSGPPTPPEVLMIWPLKKYEKGGRVKHVKPEALQDYLTTYMRDITKIDMLTRNEEIVLSKKMQIGLKLRDSQKRLAVELGYEPSKKEWAEYLHMPIGELVRKLEEAEFARDKMVMANLRLVVSVAKRYHSYGLEMADLIQEGSIGLLRGVEKFDHTRGYKLSTYVHWWIRQGVTRAIADHSRTVRVPVHVHDTLGRIRKAKSKLLAEGSRASIQDLSEATSLSGTKVKNALKVTKKLLSLDMEMGRNTLQRGDGETLHGLVGDQDGRSQPWKVVEKMMMKVDVDRLLNSELGPRERDIVRLHYGVGCQDGNPMSLESISHRYGVSRERVRQLETAAMRKLQIASREHGLDCYRQSLL